MPLDKNSIRGFAIAARRSIPHDQRAILSAAVAGRISLLPELGSSQLVLGYIAKGEEIDPAKALQTLAGMGHTIAHPRIIGRGALTLHTPRSERELETGPYGITQPTMDSPEVDPAGVGIVIVPGVAFDEMGGRLGYGGGYYDRLLPRMEQALRVGLCFDEQLLDTVPHEAHDNHVDVIVTPTRVTRTHGRGHAPGTELG